MHYANDMFRQVWTIYLFHKFCRKGESMQWTNEQSQFCYPCKLSITVHMLTVMKTMSQPQRWRILGEGGVWNSFQVSSFQDFSLRVPSASSDIPQLSQPDSWLVKGRRSLMRALWAPKRATTSTGVGMATWRWSFALCSLMPNRNVSC